jgi:hypothetical protein
VSRAGTVREQVPKLVDEDRRHRHQHDREPCSSPLGPSTHHEPGAYTGSHVLCARPPRGRRWSRVAVSPRRPPRRAGGTRRSPPARPRRRDPA